MRTIFLLAAMIACCFHPQPAQASSTESNITVRYWLNGDELKKKHINWFKMPDIFVVAEIEGQGQFLLPSIERGYQGQEVLLDFKAGEIQKGQKILISFYADHSTANELWNRAIGSKPVSIHFLGADIQLGLNMQGKEMAIRGPQYIAQAEFTAGSGSFQQAYTLQDPATGIRHGQVFLTVTQ